MECKILSSQEKGFLNNKFQRPLSRHHIRLHKKLDTQSIRALILVSLTNGMPYSVRFSKGVKYCIKNALRKLWVVSSCQWDLLGSSGAPRHLLSCSVSIEMNYFKTDTGKHHCCHNGPWTEEFWLILTDLLHLFVIIFFLKTLWSGTVAQQ